MACWIQRGAWTRFYLEGGGAPSQGFKLSGEPACIWKGYWRHSTEREGRWRPLRGLVAVTEA